MKGVELLKAKQILFEAVLGPCLWGRERADAFFPKSDGMEAGLEGLVRPALLGGVDLKDENEGQQESGDAQDSEATGPSGGAFGWRGFECCEFLAGFIGKAQQEQVRIKRVMVSVLIQGRVPLSNSCDIRSLCDRKGVGAAPCGSPRTGLASQLVSTFRLHISRIPYKESGPCFGFGKPSDPDFGCRDVST